MLKVAQVLGLTTKQVEGEPGVVRIELDLWVVGEVAGFEPQPAHS